MVKIVSIHGRIFTLLFEKLTEASYNNSVYQIYIAFIEADISGSDKRREDHVASFLNAVSIVHVLNVLGINRFFLRKKVIVLSDYHGQVLAVFAKEKIIENFRVFEHGFAESIPYGKKLFLGGCHHGAAFSQLFFIFCEIVQRGQKNQLVNILKV